MLRSYRRCEPMHFIEVSKQDGRALRLYGRRSIVCVDPAPSPNTPATAGDPHMRWQPLRGEWVVYAPHRQSRTFLPPAQFNPLRPTIDPACPTELPRGQYDVAVFDNLFPSLSPMARARPELLVPTRPGDGRCEVVVYSQDPGTPLGGLPLDHIESGKCCVSKQSPHRRPWWPF
jgi:UDPglucose--hexose-1-phosphate uridylyltransferase